MRESLIRTHGRPRTEKRPYSASPPGQSAARPALSLSSCTRHGPALRPNVTGASARSRKRPQNVNPFLPAETPQPGRESPARPRFSPLSALRKTALRQEISVFAARKQFLSAKKFHFCRTKNAVRPDSVFAWNRGGCLNIRDAHRCEFRPPIVRPV